MGEGVGIDWDEEVTTPEQAESLRRDWVRMTPERDAAMAEAFKKSQEEPLEPWASHMRRGRERTWERVLRRLLGLVALGVAAWGLWQLRNIP